MGKAGSVPESELDRLLDARIEMQSKIRKVRMEVEREYKAKIEEDIEYRTRNIERAFAVQLVDLKEAGATYSELVKVLGQGTASVMRKYVELGGGSVQKRMTGSERAQERINKLGVRREGDQFVWTLGSDNVDCQLIWRNGRPSLWPIGDEALLTLRDGHGITLRDMSAKGAEVAAEFGITEGAKK